MFLDLNSHVTPKETVTKENHTLAIQITIILYLNAIESNGL
jgi:hypothetical protein